MPNQPKKRRNSFTYHQGLKDGRKEVVEEIEKWIINKWGEDGKMSGSFGYQGIVSGIQAFQTPEDQMRDDLLSHLKNLK